MFVLIDLFGFFVLLSVSAWISAAEIGLTSLSNYKIKKIMVQKPKILNSLTSWLKTPNYLLTVILIINVAADMFISFLSTHLMTNVFYMTNRYAVEAAAWIITSAILLIFGEMIPKFYARLEPEKITIVSVPILSVIGKFLKPFLFPIIKITEFLSPKTSPITSSFLSKEEIESLLSDGTYSGKIDKETNAMIKRTFNFENLSVKEIMVPIEEIESVNLYFEEEKLLDMAIETARSRIPVYAKIKNNIIGYLHIKDILKFCQENKGHFIRAMIKEPHYVGECKKTNELLKEFKSGKTHIAFVKSKDGTISGMLTLEDILEKVVGEIVDEYE
jgi:CBS domain containing-hemolysin-like protein